MIWDFHAGIRWFRHAGRNCEKIAVRESNATSFSSTKALCFLFLVGHKKSFLRNSFRLTNAILSKFAIFAVLDFGH